MELAPNENFSIFYQRWITQLGEYVDILSQLSKQTFDSNNKSNVEAVVEKVITHHKEYYSVKWAAAHQNALPFFRPGWLSPMEHGYLWHTGWKPFIAFRILDTLKNNQVPGLSTLKELSTEQLEKIKKLKIEIMMEERKVERDMERQQMFIAYPVTFQLAQLMDQVNDGDIAVANIDALVDSNMRSYVVGMEKVLKRADYARLKTLKLVLEILDLKQSVQFLAGLSKWQVNLSNWTRKNQSTSQASTSASASSHQPHINS
ncbi:putative transcription factor TGA like domain-containing protein [Heracleum sosnowskyi]|uniref:Transcription factor TGA like domain-containing protein n=1 Tax=Heracleum sosnowskyi TaxID=360622 RepID=A0AAD8IW42_9APIA|nr:putative transcription factor TGA like domain-containing protein [Heracleum sosnowskyi]